MEIHLKPAVLARLGLPDMAYPIPPACLSDTLAADGELPLAVLLLGLQQRCSQGDGQWWELEPAMERLATLLAPEDDRDVATATGDDWWLEIGPVSLDERLVTIQRGGVLVAAMRPRPDGRLRVAVFRPLDAKSATYLTGLGLLPDTDGTVCMRENNWEYALDSSAGRGNHYAADRGEAYLSYWEKGLGISWDDSIVPEWHAQRNLRARPATRVATELGVHYLLSAAASEASISDEGTTPS